MKYPFYDNLDSMWWGIPSFDPELMTSDPTINYGDSLLDVVKNRSKGDLDGPEDNADLDHDPTEEDAFLGDDVGGGELDDDEVMKEIDDQIPAHEGDGGMDKEIDMDLEGDDRGMQDFGTLQPNQTVSTCILMS